MKINILLFDKFETLDAFGPAEIFGKVQEFELDYFSVEGGLSVCTGSALLAKCGALDGIRATSNKRAFDWVKTTSQKTLWVKKARWVVAGKIYTSSGVSAGMDMALGFVSDILGKNKANEIARRIEYVWNDNPEKDEFSEN